MKNGVSVIIFKNGVGWSSFFKNGVGGARSFFLGRGEIPIFGDLFRLPYQVICLIKVRKVYSPKESSLYGTTRGVPLVRVLS